MFLCEDTPCDFFCFFYQMIFLWKNVFVEIIIFMYLLFPSFYIVNLIYFLVVFSQIVVSE